MSFAGKPPQPRPAATPAAARARFAELADRDRGGISAAGRSRLLGGGGRAPLAVVLLHGLTNAPEQWLRFAEEARARGMAAVVPRLPGHGHTDRSARRLGDVPGEAYLRAASDAVDVACGIGDRVAVVGLSIGSGIGLRVALGRDDVARVVAAVPLLGIKGLARPVDEALAFALTRLPNATLAWDPRRGSHLTGPPWAYPRFATRALGRTLAIGLDVARSPAPPAARVTFVLNAREPAIDNPLAKRLAKTWNGVRPGSASVDVLDGLPAMHDIVDPSEPGARIDLVYPRLFAALEGG